MLRKRDRQCGIDAASKRRVAVDALLCGTCLDERGIGDVELSEMPRIAALRDRVWSGIEARFGTGVVLHGHPDLRLPNTRNCSFIGASGGEILAGLDGVAASAGSACHAGQTAPSPVLQAMGIAGLIARGAICFSLWRETTAGEIDAVVQRLPTRL